MILLFRFVIERFQIETEPLEDFPTRYFARLRKHYKQQNMSSLSPPKELHQDLDERVVSCATGKVRLALIMKCKMYLQLEENGPKHHTLAKIVILLKMLKFERLMCMVF